MIEEVSPRIMDSDSWTSLFNLRAWRIISSSVSSLAGVSSRFSLKGSPLIMEEVSPLIIEELSPLMMESDSWTSLLDLRVSRMLSSSVSSFAGVSSRFSLTGSPLIMEEVSPLMIEELSPRIMNSDSWFSLLDLRVSRMLSSSVSSSTGVSSRFSLTGSPLIMEEVSPLIIEELSPRIIDSDSWNSIFDLRAWRMISSLFSRTGSPLIMEEVSPLMIEELSPRMMDSDSWFSPLDLRVSRMISSSVSSLPEVSSRSSRTGSPLIMEEGSPLMMEELSPRMMESES